MPQSKGPHVTRRTDILTQQDGIVQCIYLRKFAWMDDSGKTVGQDRLQPGQAQRPLLPVALVKKC